MLRIRSVDVVGGVCVREIRSVLDLGRGGRCAVCGAALERSRSDTFLGGVVSRLGTG